MSAELDAGNLSISCKADTKWGAVAGAARKAGFLVPVQPLSEKDTTAEWLMEDRPSMGSLKYGTPASAVRSLRLTAGSGAGIVTGYPALSDFASGSNIGAMLLGTGAEFARLKSATFKLVPLGELRALHFTVPASGLLPLVEAAVKAVPALYHVDFSAAGAEAVARFIVEGDAAVCAIAEARLREVAAAAGARPAEPRSPYETAAGAGEWRLPLCALAGAAEALAASGGFAGIVERGIVRVKASPPDGLAKAWADRGHVILHGAYTPGETATLAARVKQAFDPEGRLEPKGALAARLPDLEEAPAPPLIDIQPSLTDAQKHELVELLGAPSVSFEEYDRLVYSHDLAPLPREVEIVFKRLADAIVLVRSAGDAVKLVNYATDNGVALVPRGGASWGFGGCVPVKGGIVADLSFMMGIEVLEDERLAVCEPGATWKQVTAAAAKKGLTVGAYPGSSPVATVAGWLSTNGAGLCSYGYGTACDQVAWVEAVMNDGGVVCTRRAPFNLGAVFAGAEGTLGIITKVAVRLRPIAPVTRPLAYAMDSTEALSGPLTALTRSPANPLHIALFDGAHFRYMKLLGRHAPEVGGMLFVVLEGTDGTVAAEEKLVDALMEKHGARRLPQDVAEHEWEERCYELRARRLGPGGVLGEAVIPVREFGAVAREVQAVALELGMQPSINGVVVDRNTIALMPYFLTDERAMLRSLGGAMGFVKKIVDIGIAHGGRPSGLGIFFAGNMDKLHDVETATLLSDLKGAMDPHSIINPGKHTEMGTRFGLALPPFIVDIGMAMMAVLKRGMPDRLPEGDELKERLKGAHE
jgi:glycolate oxidase